MKIKRFALVFFVLFIAALSMFGQTSVLINDPTVGEPAKPALTQAEQALMDRVILPKARQKLASDSCEETIEIAGRLSGAFTKAGAAQTLIFYQFCQTGNGLGTAGVAVIENDRVVSMFVAENSGWTYDARALPDINQNGTNEIALYYSGGMHQGAGGTGVDIFEIAAGRLNGIGWYQAEGFTADGPVVGYRVTVKPGAKPAFFKERYVQNAAGKWRKTGKPAPLKLSEVNGKFETVK